jgi:phenylalanyl-tRNA synthetase beta chain
MVTVTLKKKILNRLLGRELSNGELQEKLPLIKCGVESSTPEELEIEVTGDRPDLLSSEGVARALKGFLGQEKGLHLFNVAKASTEATVDKSVQGIRPFLACAVVEGASFEDEDIAELMQIQEKLHQTHGRRRRKAAIGIHDYEKIRPPLYYRAVRPRDASFVPLGLQTACNLQEILEKHSKGIEYAFTLEGKQLYPVIFDASGDVVSFPPIINAARTEVTEETTRLLVEVTGTEFEACNTALNILCANFADRGAKIHGVKINYAEKKLVTPENAPTIMHVSTAEANRVLGLNLRPSEAAECLEKQRIGARIEGNFIACEIPRYRADFIHPIDLVEEISIGYGYNAFEPKRPSVFTKGEASPLTRKTNLCRDLLLGAGFLEASTPVLASEERFAKACAQEKPLLLSNPVSKDYVLIRSSLAPNILELLSKNTHAPYPQKVFEVGEVVLRDERSHEKSSTYYSACAATAHAAASITEIASLAMEVLKRQGINCELAPTHHDQFIHGRAAAIISEGKEIGALGEVSPAVLEGFGLTMPVALFEARIARIEY